MKTVYAYVVADLLHHGHIRHIKRARFLGDFLTVGILSARATMEKKPKPIMSLSNRIEIIRALRWVDGVIEQKTYSPLENVKRLKPDILAESTSHKIQPANDYVRSYGGKVVVLPYTEGISSTIIKEKIINEYKKVQHG